MIEYKGYLAGLIEFDAEEGVFSGTVAGLKDVVHFEGTNARDLKRAFKDSIDDYLDFCAKRGKTPDKPFNGKILLRTDPELHRKAALQAAAEGVSISQWITKRIEAA